MIPGNIAQLQEISLSSYIYHNINYSNDNCSIDSDLDFVQDNGPTGYNQLDSYNFLHNTDTSPLTDIPHDFNYKYYSYTSNSYIEIDNGFNSILMTKLTDNDIDNHIREITKDVTCMNFDRIYSYARQQMVVYHFDKIFQGIIDVESSCTFPLSLYFHMELCKDYILMCPYA